MAQLNYAKSYSQALDQAFPYVLNFGALYSTPNNGRYRWVNSKTIEIPTISVKGRTDADRDTIGTINRSYDNNWTPKTLENFRKWDTLVHPMDIDETNYTTSIANITQVYNETEKFPEMDAYCVSKIYSEWKSQSMTADTTVIDENNVIQVFNKMNLEMSNKRVPATGRILYVTPAVKNFINTSKEMNRQINLKDSSKRLIYDLEGIDLVDIVSVPPELMGTIYDFTIGWKKGTGSKQINMFLVHPMAVITPIQYTFARLDSPSAGSQGKWVYYEESYEDVFILNNKKDAIQFNIEA